MGGRPVVAVNLLGWPRDVLPFELATEVLRGGLAVAGRPAATSAAGTAWTTPSRSTAWRSPAWPTPHRLLRNDAGVAALPLTLTKPLGVGVLNSRHKSTGEVFPEAIAAMTALNRDAAALALGPERAAPPTSPASACSVTCTSWPGPAGSPRSWTRPPCPTSTAPARRCGTGFVSGGTRRNLDWVRPHLDAGAVGEDELLLLADAQTSGGLLVAGELPGHPVIGELVPARAGHHDRDPPLKAPRRAVDQATVAPSARRSSRDLAFPFLGRPLQDRRPAERTLLASFRVPGGTGHQGHRRHLAGPRPNRSSPWSKGTILEEITIEAPVNRAGRLVNPPSARAACSCGAQRGGLQQAPSPSYGSVGLVRPSGPCASPGRRPSVSVVRLSGPTSSARGAHRGRRAGRRSPALT